MLKLKKLCQVAAIAWAMTAATISAEGKNVSCAAVGYEQAFSSLTKEEVTVCFFHVPTPPEQAGQLSKDPDSQVVYTTSELEGPALVYELPYAGTQGKIVDAFFLNDNVLHDVALVVIHSIDSPRSWDTVGDVFDVSVFRRKGTAFSRDEQLSRFFDMGGDRVDAEGRKIYEYPYKNRHSIDSAMASVLFQGIAGGLTNKGMVLGKAAVFGGDIEPSGERLENVYLPKGESVDVLDSVAGWCKVNSSLKSNSTPIWLLCTSLKIDDK